MPVQKSIPCPWNLLANSFHVKRKLLNDLIFYIYFYFTFISRANYYLPLTLLIIEHQLALRPEAITTAPAYRNGTAGLLNNSLILIPGGDVTTAIFQCRSCAEIRPSVRGSGTAQSMVAMA